jgi:hypothetical protein
MRGYAPLSKHNSLGNLHSGSNLPIAPPNNPRSRTAGRRTVKISAIDNLDDVAYEVTRGAPREVQRNEFASPGRTAL